jgi:RNase P subunit RPR2
MAYVSHQDTYGNVVFRENGVAKGAFQRIANHGRTVIRLRIDTPSLYQQLYCRVCRCILWLARACKIRIAKGKYCWVRNLVNLCVLIYGFRRWQKAKPVCCAIRLLKYCKRNWSIKRECARLWLEINRKTISNPYKNDFKPLYFYTI